MHKTFSKNKSWPIISVLTCNNIFWWIAVLVLSVIGSGEEVSEKAESKITKCPSQPEIRLLSPTNDDDDDLKVYNYLSIERDTIWIGERVNVTLECRSSKPIDFDFEGHLALELHHVETFRIPANITEDNDEEECFKIHVTFSSDREATGQYQCWNIGNKTDTNSSSELYIYAAGITPQYLVLGNIGEEITVHAKNSELAILPCSVTNPKIPVALYRTTREGFELLTPANHFQYDPKTGFTIQLKKFPDPFGKYKCVAKGQPSVQDEVVLQLEESEEDKIADKDSQPQMFQNPFSKGRDRQSILCTGGLGLAVKTTTNCRSVIECRLVEKCMHGVTTCPHSCKCSNSGQSCSKNLIKQYFNEVDKPLEEQCETVGKNENGGTLYCTTSKFLEGSSSTYFIGLGGKIVQNWRNAPSDEVLSMAAPLGTHVTYNVGEKIPFACVASRFVCSQGFRWKLQLQNGSMISANATTMKTRITDSLLKEDVLIHISQPEIKQIVCEAPIWNETSWLNSSLTIKVQDTVAPTFLDPVNVTVYFHPNDKNKTLICEAEGFPHPDILWYKNGEEIRSDLIFDATKDNLTVATLTFPEIGESEHGVIYSCNASNPRGMVYKTYTVYVRVSLWTVIFSILGAALFVCFVVVLIMSVQLFKGGRKPSGYTFHFTDFDVDEFKLGNPEAVNCSDNIVEKAFYLPYDEKLYEIKEENLLMDYDTILGQGEFGIVVKGKVTLNERQSYTVAIKTLKSHDLSHLKALLSELKIMIYLGYHKNVVRLIGAVTSQLSERRAFVVVEYCALGSLENYIRTRRTSFLDEYDVLTPENPALTPSEVIPSYVRFNYAIKTTDLVKWSYEIATGLEYLASKKIIHGDVALRNVLLDANQTAKVTDFGLSKQLYKRSSYYLRNSKDVPLPWKWLAPESLSDNSFSVQSDVWGFGILLWELFSLAEVPYFGVTFNTEFIQKLANGYRLDKPRYSNMEMYSIMRECWREDAGQRPSFTMLRHDFAQKLPQEILIDSDSDEDIATQNATNHLQEVLLPNFIEECQPLRV